MKFAIAALLLANTQAVKLSDDCGGKWCNKGLAYDLDEATLRKAEADNAAKTHHFNGSTIADKHAKEAAAAADAHASATAAADAAAGAAKSAAAAEFAGTSYKDKAAVAKVEADLISARKGRDLAASTANKQRSDANLKA